MSKKPLRLIDYLEHMLEAIGRIRRYTADETEAAFLQDELVQDAVIRNIEIIGEAANNIQQADAGFVERHADVPWKVMRAMRNRVSHGYFEVDLAIVWRTIQEDLPKMEVQIGTLIDEIGSGRQPPV